MEEWREIPGTLYSVSSDGRVASRKFGKCRVLKGVPNSDGYPCVHLCGGSGERRTVSVHKLVAEAFLGPRPTPKHQANHIDGVRTNPRADNLEWVTNSGNQRHRFDVLGLGNAHGEAHGNSKVTEVEVREIRKRYAAGEPRRVIAAAYRIGQSTVSMITTRKSWAWLD